MTNRNLKMWDQIAEKHESTIPLDFSSHLTHLSHDAKVLEVGSGYGRVLAYLREFGLTDLVGIDGSLVMVRRSIAAGHKNVAVACAEHLPFRRDTFDCVICIGTLSSIAYSEDRQAAIAEVARVLKPGGIFLFRDFTLTLRGRRLLRYLLHAIRLRRFGNFVSAEQIEFHHFSHQEVHKLLRRAHLTLVKLIPESFTTMHGNYSRGITVVAVKE
jgi:SAM-dependent methyltransferase